MSNADVTRQYFDRLSAGDRAAAVAMFAPGARFATLMGEMPVPDGALSMLGGFDTAFPGHRFEVTRIIEAGEDVAVEGVWSGTNTGPMMLPDGSQSPATGRIAHAPFVTMFKVRDGQIAEHVAYWDLAGFMAQLQG